MVSKDLSPGDPRDDFEAIRRKCRLGKDTVERCLGGRAALVLEYPKAAKAGGNRAQPAG